jgi:antitoxin (DNA-binding transcriptional repressor) of toxin-antitoxin stability system
MRRVSVTELKNKLSKYLRLVKQGETIEVLEHSVPIARVERMGGGGAGADARLRRLVEDGVVSPARRQGAEDLLKKPAVPCAVDPARILVEQRGDR